MVRIDDIQENLLHLIGWRQSYDRNDGTWLSESLTQSDSKQYYQSFHPLLTLQNLLSIAPDFKNTNYPEFSIENSYKKDEVVKKPETEQLYKAKKDVPANTANLDNQEYWAETNPFSE